LIEYEEN